MQFDWDPAKAKANLAKHGISFPQATAVLSDLDAIDVPDPHEGEERSRIRLCRSDLADRYLHGAARSRRETGSSIEFGAARYTS